MLIQSALIYLMCLQWISVGNYLLDLWFYDENEWLFLFISPNGMFKKEFLFLPSCFQCKMQSSLSKMSYGNYTIKNRPTPLRQKRFLFNESQRHSKESCFFSLFLSRYSPQQISSRFQDKDAPRLEMMIIKRAWKKQKNQKPIVLYRARLFHVTQADSFVATQFSTHNTRAPPESSQWACNVYIWNIAKRLLVVAARVCACCIYTYISTSQCVDVNVLYVEAACAKKATVIVYSFVHMTHIRSRRETGRDRETERRKELASDKNVWTVRMKILINFGIREKRRARRQKRIESRNRICWKPMWCDVCTLADGIAVPFGCVAAHSMPLVIIVVVIIVFSFSFT